MILHNRKYVVVVSQVVCNYEDIKSYIVQGGECSTSIGHDGRESAALPLSVATGLYNYYYYNYYCVIDSATSVNVTQVPSYKLEAYHQSWKCLLKDTRALAHGKKSRTHSHRAKRGQDWRGTVKTTISLKRPGRGFTVPRT